MEPPSAQDQLDARNLFQSLLQRVEGRPLCRDEAGFPRDSTSFPRF